MAGFGGSGKTTLAHVVGEQLQWPVIDKDVLKSKIVRTIPGLSIDMASKLAYELLFTLAREYIVIQRISVILDTSAAFASVAEFAHDLVEEADANLKILFCKVDGQIRHVRLQQRNNHDTRGRQLPVDTSVRVKENWNLFDHLPLEYLIELDTSQALEEYLQRALLYLREERPGLCPLSPQKVPVCNY